MGDKNTLYYGDNLDILRRYVEDESVDLIYLDPAPVSAVELPFNSNADYNVLRTRRNDHGVTKRESGEEATLATAGLQTVLGA